jgi:sugar phosphate isomerase/epimerase
MGFRNVVNDGSSNPPRLRLQQSAWALLNLPRDGAEWSIIERLDRIAAAGFAGFETSVASEPEADELAGMLRNRGLAIGFSAQASEADDLLGPIELAHRMRADYLTVRVHGSLKASPDIADILEEMFDLANDAGLPLFIETHRGTVTQDLRRTVKVIDRFKKIRFTGDFSHYVLAGELAATWTEEVWDHFRPIAARCGNWHGRISFGEQSQNDIGDGTSESAQQFKRLWSMGMAAWLRKSQPGDVLPFTCELGPTPYALTDLSGRELSDRWEQSLVVKRLAEEAWSDAELSVQPAEPQSTSVEPENSAV